MCPGGSLHVNEICFEEKLDISNTREKSRKSQSFIVWLSIWVAVKLKLCDTFNYRMRDTMIGLWPPKELVQQSCNFT